MEKFLISLLIFLLVFGVGGVLDIHASKHFPHAGTIVSIALAAALLAFFN